jgi:hypothetical protein
MSFQSHRYNVHGSWVPVTHRAAGYSAPVHSAALATVLATIARATVAHVRPVMSAANRTRQAVMREAWAIKREEPGATFANCLRAAWAVINGLGR